MTGIKCLADGVRWRVTTSSKELLPIPSFMNGWGSHVDIDSQRIFPPSFRMIVLQCFGVYETDCFFPSIPRAFSTISPKTFVWRFSDSIDVTSCIGELSSTTPPLPSMCFLSEDRFHQFLFDQTEVSSGLQFSFLVVASGIRLIWILRSPLSSRC